MKTYVIKYKHSSLQGWQKYGILEGESYGEVERIAKAVVARVHSFNPSDIDIRAYRMDRPGTVERVK